jgi:hypothetical protein
MGRSIEGGIRGLLVVGLTGVGGMGVVDAVNGLTNGYGDQSRGVVANDVTSRPGLEVNSGSLIGTPEDPLVPCVVNPDTGEGECPSSEVGPVELGDDAKKTNGGAGAMDDHRDLGLCGTTVVCEPPLP